MLSSFEQLKCFVLGVIQKKVFDVSKIQKVRARVNCLYRKMTVLGNKYYEVGTGAFVFQEERGKVT